MKTLCTRCGCGHGSLEPWSKKYKYFLGHLYPSRNTTIENLIKQRYFREILIPDKHYLNIVKSQTYLADLWFWRAVMRETLGPWDYHRQGVSARAKRHLTQLKFEGWVESRRQKAGALVLVETWLTVSCSFTCVVFTRMSLKSMLCQFNRLLDWPHG